MNTNVSIPAELVSAPQWLIATPKKAPATLNDRGRIVFASAMDSVNYLDYRTAVDAADEANEMLPEAMYGVGFALTAGDPWCVVDIDIKDERNEPDPAKRTPAEYVEQLHSMVDWLDSYTERSRSGVGYHVWVRVPKEIADTLPNVKKPGIEIYFRDRYIVTTGDVVADKPIADRSSKIEALLKSIAPEKFVPVVVEPRPHAHVVGVDADEPEMSDEDVLEEMFSSGKAELYQSLYDGEWAEYYPSQSEADSALIEGILYYTRNEDQVYRIFMSSALGAREKAKRLEYVYGTIRAMMRKTATDDMLNEKVIADAGVALQKRSVTVRHETLPNAELATVSDSPMSGHGVEDVGRPDDSGVVVAHTKLISSPIPMPDVLDRVVDDGFDMQEIVHDLMRAKESGGQNDYELANFGGYDGSSVDIAYPKGDLGELMKYLVNSTTKGVKELGIAAGLAVISGIAGKAWQINNTGVNSFFVTLASSGAGKTSVINSANALMLDVAAKAPQAANVFSSSRSMSMQALLRQLDKRDSFVLRFDEFAKTLSAVSSGRSAGESSLMDEIIRMYDKSGKRSIVQGLSYSNSEKNIEVGRNIAVTILGDATTKGYYESLSGEYSEDGFLSRFIPIEYTGNIKYANYDTVKEPPGWLVDKLADIVTHADHLMSSGGCIDVRVSGDVQYRVVKIDMDAVDLINSKTVPEGRHYLYNRKQLKVLKIASLLAIMKNHIDPVIEVEEFEWALDMINQVCARELWWIKQGMVAGSVTDIEVEEFVSSEIRKYMAAPHGSIRDIALAKKGAMTSKTLRRLIELMPVAKRSRLGSREFATRTIKALEDVGIIRHHTRHHSRKMFGDVSGTCYSYDPTMDDILQDSGSGR